MSDFSESVRAYVEWRNGGGCERLLDIQRGRLQAALEHVRELRNENVLLWHENMLLREGDVPDSVSWIMMKIDRQRREIRRLRQELGYQDEADPKSTSDGPGDQSSGGNVGS